MPNTNYQHQLLKYQPIRLDLPNSDIVYDEKFIALEMADCWFALLLDEINWQQDTITLYGKQHRVPRLSSWVAEPGLAYGYSQMVMQPEPWTNTLLKIKAYVEQHTNERFNSVLVNLYRDGQDSNGWHADDEPELGHHPVIASLSLGAARDFDLRYKNDPAMKTRLPLRHGSLLMMRGETQSHWQHQVPKRAIAEKRINLTFRTIKSANN